MFACLESTFSDFFFIGGLLRASDGIIFLYFMYCSCLFLSAICLS